MAISTHSTADFSAMQSQPTRVHAAFEPRQFFYNIHWRPRTYHAGANLTSHHGNGSDFAGFANLLACPDPKRIDIRASVRTVPQQWLVRTYLERAAVRVFAIVDVSSSMLFQGEANMRQQVTEFVTALAWSANRQGDAFGMAAANDDVQSSWQILPTFQTGTAQVVAEKITRYWQSNHAVSGRNASAIPAAIEEIGPQRALVFLISDFYWDTALLQQTLKAAQAHDVIPVVLRDQSATEGMPAFGWARLRDMESGEERSWMLRKHLHQQIGAHLVQQKHMLNSQFMKAGTRSPLWLVPQWQAEEVSRHLMETMA
jgi:uncharacterized protein (DUF58 family)